MKMEKAQVEEQEYTVLDYLSALARRFKKTQEMLDLLNEKHGTQMRLPQESVNFDEPFGAILWHRRMSMRYPLCIAASLCGMDRREMFRMEMGWAMPREDYDRVMKELLGIYAFLPGEWVRIREKGLACQREEPMDLSEYLGVKIPAFCNADRPAKVYRTQDQPLSYIRHRIEVVARWCADGREIPSQVIWTDGQVFPIDRIDTAQEAVRLTTGGVGTRFSCWFGKQQRNICYQKKGQWFVETPCFR